MKTILDPELCWRVLLTLGHFLWQGAAIALTAAAAAWLLRRALARARYGVWTAALLLMTLCPLIVLSIATIWAVEAPLENEQDPSKREAIAAAPHTITDPPAAARRDVRILDYNAVTVGKPFDQRVAVTLAQATADIKQARVDCEEYPPAPGGFRYFQPVTGGFTIPLGQRADSSTQPAAQPATNSAAMVAEAFERIHQRVAALEGQHPALKGIADAKPLFGGDSAFTRREADWSFANNATGWGKAETPSAVDVSKPFCRIILYMRFPFGAMGVQPVADQRVYQVGGEAWEGFSKVFSDDAKLVEAVKTIAKEELDRFTGPPPRPAATAPSAALPAPPANLTVQLRIDPKKLALFNLSLTDVRQALTERKITVTGERVDAAGQHELDLDPDRLPKVEDLRRIVIKTPAGLSVPLEQVANILAVARDRATGAQPAKLPGNTDEQAEVERHAAENEKNMAAQKARDDQSAAAARQRDDEIAAAMRKAAQAKAAIAPEFIAKIKAMLPDGWSVATAKDVLTIRRDEKVEATYMSPGGITPERISTSDVIQIRVGPRVSGEQYARMAEENRKVLDDFRFKNPNYSPIDYRIALPHVLPSWRGGAVLQLWRI
ncbi:MAG: efflux RND transporter permease subunit [Verrucomicrobia bacterium]|nr:efflux RND transporter permease subunit [Verrucomicrobiota bacterium]